MKIIRRSRTLFIIACALVGLVALPAWLSLSADRHRQLDTDLLIALGSGKAEEVKSLLKAGADPNARDLRDVPPENPWEHLLALLTHNHSPEFEHAPCALSYATDGRIQFDPTAMVKLLLDYGADVKASEHCNDPPLILAEEWGNIETVRLLVDHGADVNVQSQAGMTALRMAIGTGDPQRVQLLLDHGARVALKKDKMGMNDFDEASWLAQRNPEYAAQYARIIALLKNASIAQGK